MRADATLERHFESLSPVRAYEDLLSSGGSGRIMVVDDQPANLHTVSSLLSQQGHEVVTALSGAEALEQCGDWVPDLILLDMRMPEMDGFEVCSLLKARVLTASVPIIFLTADTERASVIRGFEVGAVDYVGKPFVEEELLARVKTHLDLKRIQDNLSRVAQERADLSQVVAHDLKNPLTAILMAAGGANVGANPAQQAHIDTIRSSVNRCINLIDEYLGRWALAEKVSGPELDHLQAGSTLEAAALELAPRASERRMKILLDVQEDPLVVGNAMVLRQIFDNLLSNAVKYGAADTDIDVQCAVGRSGMLRIKVADRGPGIPEGQTDRLFQRYSKIDGSGDVPHSSGLGLAMAKIQAERMGAHLWHENRAGGGSVFSLALPLAAEAEAQ